MKTKFTVILTLLLALVVQISFAQNKNVSGTVSDDNGLPLPGATVVIKGTSTGVSTDFDGNFKLAVDNENATLEVSFIGFTTQKVTATANTDLKQVKEFLTLNGILIR